MPARSKKSATVSVASTTDSVAHAHEARTQEGSVPMKKSSKKPVAVADTAAKSVAVADTVLAPTPSAAEPLPSGVAPTPPSTYVQVKLTRAGRRPLRAQVNLALKVATEIRGSTDYVQQFGSAAPNPGTVADALTLARGWSDKLQNATAWYEYVRQQENLAWTQATAILAPLRVPFEFRLARDASLAEEYPSTEAFFGAASANATKAAATRKSKKKEKEAAAAALAASAPTVTPTPAPAVSAKVLN